MSSDIDTKSHSDNSPPSSHRRVTDTSSPYFNLEVGLAEKLKHAAEQIRERLHDDARAAKYAIVENGLAVGEALNAARKLWDGSGASKKKMVEWVQAEFKRSKDWAYERIHAAEAFHGQGLLIRPLLWKTVVYLARDDRADLRAEALKLLKKGNDGPAERDVAKVEKLVEDAREKDEKDKEPARKTREAEATNPEEQQANAKAERAASFDPKAEANRVFKGLAELGIGRAKLLAVAEELKRQAEELPPEEAAPPEEIARPAAAQDADPGVETAIEPPPAVEGGAQRQQGDEAQAGEGEPARLEDAEV